MTTSRLIVIQGALPFYRIAFFERLSQLVEGRLVVYYSGGKLGVLTDVQVDMEWSNYLGEMKSVGGGFEWQSGALCLPIKKGDVVVIPAAPRCISNYILAILLRIRGVKTVFWGHYWSSTSAPHRFFLRMILLRLSNALLFYTDQEVLEYKGGVGCRDRRVVMALNNGIDLKPIDSLRRCYFATARERKILFIGRLTQKAEVDVLIRALCDPRLADYSLEVVGGGEELGYLCSLAARLNVDERLIWRGATVDEEVIAKSANSSMLFVYPGAVGLSLIHAMAYGLPSIIHADRWGHGPEVSAFEQDRTGKSFSRGDPLSLANAIVAATSDHSWLDDASRRAKDVVDGSYNINSMANRLKALRDSLLC